MDGWLTPPQEGAAPDPSGSGRAVAFPGGPGGHLQIWKGQRMDPRNGNIGNVARVSRALQLESLVSPATWGLSTGQSGHSPYRTRGSGGLRTRRTFCFPAVLQPLCATSGGPVVPAPGHRLPRWGVSARAEDLAGAKALSRCAPQAVGHVGTGTFWSV